MLGIKIKDKRQSANGGGILNFDLRDILPIILSIIGDPVKQSKWLCYDLWFTARRDGEFNEFRGERLKLSGIELVQLASEIHQTINGRFEAKGQGAAKSPWLIIIAFDSSWFEVWSSKPWVIERMKEHFQNVVDIPMGTSPSLVK
jgi:hypothetical protein